MSKDRDKAPQTLFKSAWEIPPLSIGARQLDTS